MVWWGLVISVAAFGAASNIGEADYNLRILHMNDFHSRFQPVTKRGGVCDLKKVTRPGKECIGGIARIKYFTDELLRKTKENTIFVNAGDAFQVNDLQ